MPAQDLSSILQTQGLISADQAERLRLQQINTGEDLKKIILDSGLVKEEDLIKASAKINNLPYVDLKEIAFSPVALGFLPQVVAQEYQVVPFEYQADRNELSVAMADPTNLEAIEFISQKTKAKIIPFQALSAQIQEAINYNYSQGLTSEVQTALGEVKDEPVKIRPGGRLNGGSDLLKEEKIAKIVSTILEFAIKSRASDVHIEPEEDKTRVRYRIDGILHEKLSLPKPLHEAVISRIKILSGLRIDEKRIPQDGRFNFKTADQEVDLRISSLPTTNGEKIVMRLLKKSGGVPDLQELGLRGRALKNLEDAILRPHGIIIVCGPTGSGKTTTLYSVLSRLNTNKVNIITLEDPVEYQIDGVNQVQVNPGAKLTFASGMRSFLRQDPNIIMVGEIRDSETTNLAIQASLTGHLVFSTLHTNNASQAIPRLLDLGAEPFLIASSVTCLVAQRICRKICPQCQEEYVPSADLTADLEKVLGKLMPKEKSAIKLVRGKKCANCNNTGYFGRIGIFEVLPVTEKMARLVLERAPAGEIEKQAFEEGMITMKQDGYLKVLEKITTIEEVLRVAQE